MNERIGKLAEKATTYIEPTATSGEGWIFDKEKFAELIVRDCINKITTYDLVPGHSAKWEDIYDIHARLLQDLGEELKEHFGVER